MSAKKLAHIIVRKHDTRNPLGVPIPTRFPVSHLAQIEQFAAEQEVTRSDVVRAIVSEVLGEAA